MGSLTLRTLQGLDDVDGLLEIHRLCNDSEGDDPRSMQAYRPKRSWFEQRLSSLDPADWILAEHGGTIAGYGQTRWNWAERDGTYVQYFAFWIRPDWRNRNVEAELIARIESRCRERASSVKSARNEYRTGILAAEVNTAHHLERNGYTLAYHSWEMELAANHFVEVSPLAGGYDLRPIEPEHHRAIWQCIGDSFDASCPTGQFVKVPTEEAMQPHFLHERPIRTCRSSRGREAVSPGRRSVGSTMDLGRCSR